MLDTPNAPSPSLPPTRLVFVLHFHQPFGNLERVFEDATKRCYMPTLGLLSANPHVRAGIHVSGPLLQWFLTKRKDVIQCLKSLAAEGQIEILGGGIEEPMLAILPERDALGQLTSMADLCERRLGARPRGMWLAERVWEPDLPRLIAAAGYTYTLLDDSHLIAAGVTERPNGYYVTEKTGASIRVLPIDRGLRTRIPFAEMDDLFKYLADARGSVLTYGDDVEKFGLWPTTEKRVWTDRWLERFFQTLGEKRDVVETVTPSMVFSERPRGLVYLPTISYAEMGAWALPTDAGTKLADVTQKIAAAGLADESAAFLRGGIWQGFLAKYPESRRIYRKMLRVSNMVETARTERHMLYLAARTLLYRGQCNCAYWHGLFGGLYLQHLRSALMSALIEAETLVSSVTTPVASRLDYDGDFGEEVLLEAPHVNVYLSPARGGAAFEIDLRAAHFDLLGVLGRRRETYHRDVARARVLGDDELANVSAHDLVRATAPNLAEKLARDSYDRGAFIDHILLPDASPAALSGNANTPLVDMPNTPYSIEEAASGNGRAFAVLRGEHGGFSVRKAIAVDSEREILVRYRAEFAGARGSICFASEIDFTLLAPDAADGRSIELIGSDGNAMQADPAPGATAAHVGVREIRIIGVGVCVDLRIKLDPPAEVWRFPIETVSQSERGFEPGYQGTALALAWRGEVGEGRTIDPTIRIEVVPPV